MNFPAWSYLITPTVVTTILGVSQVRSSAKKSAVLTEVLGSFSQLFKLNAYYFEIGHVPRAF
jgi:hypothetical protein